MKKKKRWLALFLILGASPFLWEYWTTLWLQKQTRQPSTTSSAPYIPTFTFRCGDQENSLPSKPEKVNIVVPPTGCWTNIAKRPDYAFEFRMYWPQVPGKSHLEVEHVFSDGTTQIVTLESDNDFDDQDFFQGYRVGMRFRNTGTVPLTATIQLR